MTSYPPAPWSMHGSMWLSVFHLGHDIDEHHPAGVYGAAFVDYREPSPLTYGELLVARTVSGDEAADAGRGRRVTITDIWVDSPASRAGGRSLWAIPKELCDFDHEQHVTGPVTRSRWSATTESGPIAAARFRDVSRAAVRLPLHGRVRQPGIAEHPDTAHVTMKGTARALPARGHWRFAPQGPLAFLTGARQLATFRMHRFRLHFG